MYKVISTVLGVSALAAGLIFFSKATSESEKIRDRMPTALAECNNFPYPVPTLNGSETPTTVISTTTLSVEGYIFLCKKLKNQDIQVVAPLTKEIAPKE